MKFRTHTIDVQIFQISVIETKTLAETLVKHEHDLTSGLKHCTANLTPLTCGMDTQQHSTMKVWCVITYSCHGYQYHKISKTLPLSVRQLIVGTDKVLAPQGNSPSSVSTVTKLSMIL